MRAEFYGCEADDVISCAEPAQTFMLDNTPDGTPVTRNCPAQCREAMGNNIKIYGF